MVASESLGTSDITRYLNNIAPEEPLSLTQPLKIKKKKKLYSYS